MIKVDRIDKDFGYDELMRYASRTRNTTLQVGVRDEVHEKSGENIGLIATVHEFGIGVPERSFLRSTLEANESVYDHMTVSPSHQSVARRFEAIGRQAVRDIRERIDSYIPPPLAEVTVARKGHDKPLVDTKQLYDAISFKVEGSRVPLPKAMR